MTVDIGNDANILSVINLKLISVIWLLRKLGIRLIIING
jgi:hypothetical protein